MDSRVDYNIENLKKSGLDLVYVTNNIMAMSFPYSVEDKDPSRKNRINNVEKYLDENHPNNYIVYNLCAEHDYGCVYFHGNVKRFPIVDFDVPTLKNVISFLNYLRNDQKDDPKKMRVFHCLGGKGRTGTLVTMVLLLNQICNNAEEAMKYFAYKRTNGDANSHFKGVETPSQVRLVKNFDRLLHDPSLDIPSLPLRKLKLKEIKINGVNDKKLDWIIKICSNANQNELELVNGKNCEIKSEKANIIVTLKDSAYYKDELKFKFNKWIAKLFRTNFEFSFTLHVSFMDSSKPLILKRNELDGLHEENNLSEYYKDLSIEILFQE